MEITERLEVFFRRLGAAPPATDAASGLRLVCRLIEEVEDEFCPVPREDPPPEKFTGRMYAPRPDRIAPLDRDALVAETRQHRIVCLGNGEISIVHKHRNQVVFFKEGQR